MKRHDSVFERTAMRLARGTLAVAVWLSACAPTPSAKPLGWGPLLPGMQRQAAHRAAAHPSAHEAPKQEEASSAPATSPDEAAVEAATTGAAAAPADTARAGSAKPGGGPTTAAFVGEYTGEDVSIYRIEGLPDRTEKDPKARMTVTSSSDSSLAFELVDSSNGNEICTLDATLGANGVSVGKDQKCFEQSSEDASTAATVISGTATIDQSRLVFDLDMTFEMELAGRKFSGSLSYHFDGTRK